MSVEALEVEERARLAWHEAGHAIVALREGRRVSALSVAAGPSGAALCAFEAGDGSLAALTADIRITVAGRLAEQLGAQTPMREEPAPDTLPVWLTETEVALHTVRSAGT